MSNERRFTHFEPDEVVIPTTEKGGRPPEGTQVVLAPDGTIACVGSRDDVAAFVRGRRQEGAEVTVERGGVLLPGLTDTHTHPSFFRVFELLKTVDVSTADSVAAFSRTVRKEIANADLRQGEPFIALNFDSGRVGALAEIDLDEVEDRRPLVVIDRSFHGGAVNTKGAELLRQYLEKTYGKRSFPGVFRGHKITEVYIQLALELAESFQDVQGFSEAIESHMEQYFTKGVTAVHDLGVFTWKEFMAQLLFNKRWNEKHPGVEFPIRRLFLDERVLARLAKEMGELEKSGLLTSELRGIMGLKLFADGTFGSETARVSEAYATTGTHGVIVNRMKDAERAMKQVLKLGLRSELATHGIGDAGIARAIEFARRWQTIAESKGAPPRVRFEHFELPLGTALSDTKSLGAWVSTQPNFGVEDTVYKDRLNDRVRLLCPHAEMANRGIPTMVGTDGMPESMLYAVWAMMHHPNPKQRFDLLSAVTAASAAAGAYEGQGLRGVLRAGARTDIVVATPVILNAFANGKRADDYIEQALMPKAQRTKDVPIRDQIGDLERGIVKVFRQGQVVYDATKQAS